MSAWGSAATRAASAAVAIVLSSRLFPRSAASASVARIAVNPTQPRAMAASWQMSPAIVSCTALKVGPERDQGLGPSPAWTGLREGSADGAPVSHLHVGNSGGTVVQEGNLSRKRGVLDLIVANHCSEVKSTRFFFNKRGV